MSNGAVSKDLFKAYYAYRKYISIFVGTITLLALIVALILPKSYQAKASILIPPAEEAGIASLGILQNIPFGNSILGQDQNALRYLAILKSEALMEAVIKKYDLMKKYEVDNMDDAIKAFEGNFYADFGDESQIEISFVDTDQDQVASITNYILYCLDSLNIRLGKTRAQKKMVFAENRLRIVIDSLQVLEKSITKFMEKEGVLSLEDQVIAGISKAADLKAEILNKEIELSAMKKIMSPNSQRIKEVEIQLQSLKEGFKEFFKDQQKDRLIPNLKKVPELAEKITRMKRKVEYYTKLLEFIGTQYEQAKLDAAKNVPTIQILDYARRPDKKYKPRIGFLMVSAFFASLFIALVVIAIRERFFITIEFE